MDEVTRGRAALTFETIRQAVREQTVALRRYPVAIEVSRPVLDRLCKECRTEPDSDWRPNQGDQLMGLPLWTRDDLAGDEFALRFRSR